MATETTLAARLAEDAAERLLRYVRIDTRSDEESATYPSTPGQLELLRLLRDELEEVGLADVTMDEHGYVTGTLPATVEHDVPTVAFFAHVDTAREVSGAGVSPQRLRWRRPQVVRALPVDWPPAAGLRPAARTVAASRLPAVRGRQRE